VSRLRAAITGVGHYAPPKVLTNQDLERMVDTSDEWIRTRTGILERRIADESTATSDMAVEAALRALENAHARAEDLDFVIVATATPDMPYPATAALVQARIGATKAGACDVTCGCSGFIYALNMGAQFIAAGAYRKVLVVGADTLSKVTDFTDRNTCVLFGDGAGAVVLEAAAEGYGILSFSLRSDGSGSHLLYLKAGGSRCPATAETVARREHFTVMAGSEVFRFAVRVVAEATQAVLVEAGVGVDDVALFIPHQANLRIIEAASKRLNISMERVFVNLDRYGNTSCGSIPMALSEAVVAGRLKDGDLLVMCGFGAGLSWGATVMRWSPTRVSASPEQAPAEAVGEPVVN